jgi:hypothetical protein
MLMMEKLTKEELIQFLNSFLFYKGRGANNGVWGSFKGKEEGSPFLDLLKPHSWKTFGQAKIYYYINEYPESYDGHEIRIELRLNSYLEWDTVFEGWIDTLDEFKTILKCIGINFKTT